MEKIKFLLLILLFTLMVAVLPINAQNTESQTATESTMTKKPESIVGWAIGGIALMALGIIIVMMVRNRRTTIGGMQDQSKPSPTIVTTQSINNPGAGV
jgi:uncharacterized protein YpmS